MATLGLLSLRWAGWRLLRQGMPVVRRPWKVVPRTLHNSSLLWRVYGEQKTPPSSQTQEASTDEQEEPEEPLHHSRYNYTDQGGEESEGYESEEQLQQRILIAALDFVPEHGWSSEAIAEGAKSLNLSAAASGMFNNGGSSELILHFVSQCNTRLTEQFEEEHKLVQLGQAEKKKTDQFLRDAVEARLRMLIPYIQTWPQALSILLLPPNIPQSLNLLTSMVDDMWHYAGDQSTDINWYTRRMVLAGIYNTTELVMVQDSSPDFEETWRFLENRISDAMNLGHSAKQVKLTGEALVQGLMGAAVTLKNMTGLNQRR